MDDPADNMTFEYTEKITCEQQQHPGQKPDHRNMQYGYHPLPSSDQSRKSPHDCLLCRQILIMKLRRVKVPILNHSPQTESVAERGIAWASCGRQPVGSES
jgi:hypothetical protein